MAAVDCRELEIGTLAVEDSFYLDATVRGLAFDGDHVWICRALDDFQRMSPDGELLDEVVVWYRGQYHFGSG
jgi:hypothetical protein